MVFTTFAHIHRCLNQSKCKPAANLRNETMPLVTYTSMNLQCDPICRWSWHPLLFQEVKPPLQCNLHRMLNEVQFSCHNLLDWLLLLSPAPALHPVCHPYSNSGEGDMDFLNQSFEFASAAGYRQGSNVQQLPYRNYTNTVDLKLKSVVHVTS